MSVQHYIDSLFQPPGTSHDSDWEALIAGLESTHLAFDNDAELSEPVFETSPWPSVLDYITDSPAAPPAPPTPPPAEPEPVVASGSSSVVKEDLIDRLRRHIPATYNSLVNLLSTPRSNDDIQLELIEIMGFEGDGLSLVEELLQPGARDKVVQGSMRSVTARQIGYQPGTKNGRSEKSAYTPARMTLKGKVKDRKHVINLAEIGSAEDIERRLQEQLEGPKAMFANDGRRVVEQEVLPHVYTATGSKSVPLSHGGTYALPEGTKREIGDYFEEVVIPPARIVPPKSTERPVKIAELPPLAKGCFPKYVQLNRMQSIVQPTAMNTNENMLICAPTGAGKTDVAIMAILRVLTQHVTPGRSTHPSGFNVDRDAFKIIYVAPMKALAAEITAKFSKRLAWLGIRVRELTGDMQLTRQEIEETQIIVTTPEKWDVVTRKPTGEGELASKVKLLIIDEVHLLAEDRGAVIETIVARTLRQVESSQSLIRIVGLSATLPNYVDVGDFLRVNRYQGLFYFDASFRPVPLEQHFIGVSGKPRSNISARNMDRAVFERVSELVQQGHQVMVFVHARRETVKTATTLKEMAIEEGVSTFFEATDHPRWDMYQRELSKSKNKEMKELFNSGFGIHHAGMLRSDRNMMEKMFEDNAINVLCCTSTLAWGVNLPAHAVVIKGTQVYDSNKGSFMDLSVLDVLQIFGRAGRPGYATSGVGFIVTTGDKLSHYVQAVLSQNAIESKFIPGLTDSLNAEISLGTITNVHEAIQWLSYTYLFVRMKRNPFIYGMPHDVIKDDPQLGNKRNELITQAARILSNDGKMIRHEEMTNAFSITDLGRIAAKYYIKWPTIVHFNTKFNPRMSNADLFQMLCEATEFEQIQLRESEVEELELIVSSGVIPLEVAGGAVSKRNKVNILLQSHISNVYLQDFALVSDAAFVAQNAGRIIRALLEIALSRHWANCAYLLVDLSKCIERRQWVYDHGLAQLKVLQRETMHKLNQYTPDDMTISDFRHMTPAQLGEFIHLNERHGQAVLDAAMIFPTVALGYKLRPVSHDLLQITVTVTPQFRWNAKISGSSEPFYVWAQDEEGLNIYQWRSVRILPSTTVVDIEFVLPFEDRPPESISIVSISDKWLWSYEQLHIPLNHLVMPPPAPPRTDMLSIPFLRLACLQDPELEKGYKKGVEMLNAIQSQAFWTMYNTSVNALVSAPVGSGKSLLGEIAVWNAFRHDPAAIVLIVVPERHAVYEAIARLRSVLPASRNVATTPLLKSTDFDRLASPSGGAIGITTPHAMMTHASIDQVLCLSRLALYVLEDLHLLDELYELCVAKILSFARAARTRIVGLASSLGDPTDLAAWLGLDAGPFDEDGDRVASAPPALYSFGPADRSGAISTSIKTFSIPHGPTLLRSMVKPTYDILKQSPGGAVVFVPSERSCITVAADLVTQSGTEMDLDGLLTTPRDQVEPFVERLKDRRMYEPILHGVGYITRDTAPSDLALVLELFASKILRALIVPRQACWTLPVRGDTVIVMGAQYVQTTKPPPAKPGTTAKRDARPERHVLGYSRTELVKMQGFASTSAAPTAPGGRMFVMCQGEQHVAIARTLKEGLPLESRLLSMLKRRNAPSYAPDPRAVQVLTDMFTGRKAPPLPQRDRPRGIDTRKRDMMDILNWSFFTARYKNNPNYYDIHRDIEVEQVSRAVDVWFDEIDGIVLNTGSTSPWESREGSAEEEEGNAAAPGVNGVDDQGVEEEIAKGVADTGAAEEAEEGQQANGGV
ncbi:hypothetical protein IAT38_006683 [Cryptococcus sp. DSM 104549]